MHLHILGICGTFMGGLAVLAKQLGYQVSGSDTAVYPPMSTQLIEQGIMLQEGYDPAHLQPPPDLVIMGNAMVRGNPAVEYVLSQGIPYVSGPQWLADTVLRSRWVLAVAGTHGKTTTTSMLAWILDYAGLNPGFLIGGVAANFGISARLGESPFFVIEADEYDSAFFDKRSKFIHYRPRTLVLNNLEFDHADIFPDLDAIKQQFHHLVRTVPANGLIIVPADDPVLSGVFAKGCWTSLEYIGLDYTGTEGALWTVRPVKADGSQFSVRCGAKEIGMVSWSLLGRHNMHNALAALAAARHAGVPPEIGVKALSGFENVKRRLEIKGMARGITVYDDFAHHPTAIATTLAGLRAKIESARILAVVECGSYTMRSGVHRDHLAPALIDADEVIFIGSEHYGWLDEVMKALPVPAKIYNDAGGIVEHLATSAHAGDHIVIMSNKGFEGIHQRLLAALRGEQLAI
jgi:UDP-N-acetylmuramate: L-alanyl-gamma-D-glutamyl-meso-diaminopimelate ligase